MTHIENQIFRNLKRIQELQDMNSDLQITLGTISEANVTDDIEYGLQNK